MVRRNRGKKTGRRVRIVAGIVLLVLVGALAAAKVFVLPGINFVKAASFRAVTSSATAFKYDPAKIEVGTVYHYVKSNIDGSKPADVAIFVASIDRVEVFKVYPGAKATFVVTSDMDWEVFSAKSLSTLEIYKDGSRKVTARARLSRETNQYAYTVGQSQYSVPIGHYPVHNYNFDLTSLNFSFRHLANPESAFSIGVHVPAFDLRSLVKFVYSGQAEIKYLSDEAYNGVACRKYSIGGQGLANKTGTIWVNKEKGYIENVEIPVADNPSWKSFKLKLTGVETMSPEAWNNYIAAQSSAYFSKQGK